MKRLNNERGIALAVAIFALVVVGGLVAGSLFVATQEQRVGRNTLQQQTAFNAAEGATQEVLLNWATGTYNSMNVGGTVTTTGTAPGGGWYRRSVQRLSQMIYVVRTDGFNRDSTSRQRVGSLMRLRPLAFSIQAALTTQGQVRLGGSSQISGSDQQPTGWADCPALAPTEAGIKMPDPSLLNSQNCQNQNCITGDPPVEKDTTITGESLTMVGDIPFDSLKTFATKIVYPSGTPKIQPVWNLTTLACTTANQYNWGRPTLPAGPCGNYFPIIWVNSSISINGIEGQGVLVVNGDLDVQGGFSFFGPVIVRGVLNTQGTGGHFNGGVIAANVNLDQNVVLGDAVINYSTCALIKALTASATAFQMRERSWVNLY